VRNALFFLLLGLILITISGCGHSGESGGKDSHAIAGPDDDVPGDDSGADDTRPDDTGSTADFFVPPKWREPAEPLRSKRSLDGTWQFTPDGYAERDVQVPCFWEAWPEWPEYPSCPGYLEGTPDEHVSIYEGSNWAERAVHRGTYRTSIAIERPSPRTLIHFESINHQASVYLNEQEIGSHTGPYWKATFDLSSAVIEGTNSLRVELADGQALLGPDGITRWPVGYYSLTDITGLYRSVTIESLPEISIEDVFIVPSVRLGEVTIQYTLHNSGGNDEEVWVLGQVVDENGIALETPARRVVVPALGDAKTVIVRKWTDPEYWSPANPRLYTLRSLLVDKSGEPVDLREDRFGFREVWIADGHFMLNGMRMNLIGDSIDDQAARPRYWALQYLTCETAPATLRRVKDLNIQAIRFHQAPPEECIYDMADEMGLLIISESAVYARTEITPPFFHNDEYIENSMRYIDAMVRRQRNHPSIVMWSVENEMFMYFFEFSIDQITRLQYPAKEADAILRPDGVYTAPRPINWDGDSSFMHMAGLNPETLNWHYPNWGFLTISPDKEWFDVAIAHFQEYFVSGIPCGVGETMDVRRPFITGPTPDQTKAMQGIAVRAMRMIGYSDMRPYKLNWTWHIYDPTGHEHPQGLWYHSLFTAEQKERLVKIIRESYHPIAAFDFDYTRMPPNPDGTLGPVVLAPASRIERTLVMLNDSFIPEESITVEWSVWDMTDGVVLAEDEFTLFVENGGSESRNIRFDTPDVAGPHQVVLLIRTSMNGLPQGDYITQYDFLAQP
jgi:hypothetical protein